MPKWIRTRDINGNYGYQDLETGKFYTSIPGSAQEQTRQNHKLQKAVLKTYELDHAVHTPSQFPKGFNRNASDYFLEDNGSELAARGSQIKDYFKLTNSNQPITEDMLKYASQNYVKDTGIDNDMTEFFNSIVDWKEAAKWLSKYSTSIVVLTLGVTFPSIEAYNKQRENQDYNK